MYKQITARQAADLVRDGDTVAFNGQVRVAVAEKFFHALIERFEETGFPRGIHYIATSSFGATKLFARHKGLMKDIAVAHWAGIAADFQEEILANEIGAYSLPQGFLALNYDAAAAKVPGFLSRIGLHTIIDPRVGSCGFNEVSDRQFANPITINGKEYLLYHTIIPDISVLRGTTADVEGNITMEKEAGIHDPLSMALAAHNNGGIVIVQVERFSKEKANPHAVKIPGCLVDYIYQDEDQVMMDDAVYNPIYSGEKRLQGQELEEMMDKLYQINVSSRKPAELFIARRAALEIQDEYIINLGVGLPMLLAFEAYRMGRVSPSVTFTVECGTLGGFPTGYSFGTSVNVSALIPQAQMFRLYEGRGLDLTGVGALEIDPKGNINVFRKGDRLIGVGGFNHVTFGCKKLVVLTRFMLGSSMTKENGRLVIRDGYANKFCEKIDYINFSADMAIEERQEVLYITERCVFKLTQEGLEMIEIAPSLDPERDVLAKMPFQPKVSTNLKQMPDICFEL